MLDVHRALQLELPENAQDRLRMWSRRSDQTFVAVGHAPKYIGWRIRVNPADFAIRKRVTEAEPTLWCSEYSKATPEAKWALQAYTRYQQNGDGRFLSPVLETAERYKGTEPQCEQYPIWPGTMANVIDLMLVAYKETGKQTYLQEADRFGTYAVKTFLDDTSPLPKVLSRIFSHYEAISGGDDLMLALHRLGEQLTDRSDD